MPPPAARASYIAASACLRSDSGVSASSGKMLMPMLDLDEQLGGAELERGVHRVGDALADGLGVRPGVDRQVAQEHQEALALAVDLVGRPQRGAQPRGDLREQLLAQLGAERVADAPEVVDVHERERDGGAGRARGGHGLAERVRGCQDGD